MLSSLHRAAIIDQLAGEQFDLAVIGGGITGAGIALDAASRGLRTALVEKRDFASGTSSKSTKLIHGGLRYLKQLEIGLVREVGSERAIVHQLAPHLVRPEKMLLPLVEGGTYGRLATSMGLWVYDLLAGVSGEDRRQMLSREETLAREPLLRKDILVGGGYYAEYRTDDARLTIENIKTAVSQGALCLNYAEATGFRYDQQGKITGINCRTTEGKRQEFLLNTGCVISAAGPWVDELRREDNSLQGKHLFLTKGVHIVVPYHRFPLQQSVYFDVPDGRMVFAIPRLRSTYIGTTDTRFTDRPDRVTADRADVDYLLQAANSMFPGLDLRPADVESSWAGLRPLIHEEGKTAGELSRRDEIFESSSGLISIAGGKLTGYRKMAERAVDRAADRISRLTGERIAESRTRDIRLTGGPFDHFGDVLDYEKEVASKLTASGLPSERAAYLVSNYGRQSEKIIRTAVKQPAGDAEARLAAAEAIFTISEELALTPLDFFNRRSGRLYFDLPGISRVQEVVLDTFSSRLSWNEDERQHHADQLEKAIFTATHFAAVQP